MLDNRYGSCSSPRTWSKFWSPEGDAMFLECSRAKWGRVLTTRVKGSSMMHAEANGGVFR